MLGIFDEQEEFLPFAMIFQFDPDTPADDLEEKAWTIILMVGQDHATYKDSMVDFDDGQVMFQFSDIGALHIFSQALKGAIGTTSSLVQLIRSSNDAAEDRVEIIREYCKEHDLNVYAGIQKDKGYFLCSPDYKDLSVASSFLSSLENQQPKFPLHLLN